MRYRNDDEGDASGAGHLGALFGALGIGIGIRLFHLTRHGLFKDEGFSWAFSELPWSRFLPESVASYHPPLYYALLKVARVILPDTEFALRLPSLLFSILSLCTLAIVTRRWAGGRAAILAVSLAAVSSFDIYYAQDARMYTMLGWLWLFSTVLLLRSMERPRTFVAWGLAAAALGWTHLYGAVTATIQLGVAVGWTGWRVRQWRRSASVASGTAAAGTSDAPAPIPQVPTTQAVIADGLSFVRWFAAGSTLTALALALLLLTFWGHRGLPGGGGAWIPGAQDLGGLLALISVGLLAARGHFLDGGNLIPDALGGLPYWIWGVLGFTLAIPACRAWWAAARGRSASGAGNPRNAILRRVAWVTLAVAILPVVVAFAHARGQQLETWAYKPFLGVAYLFFFWSGIGIVRTRRLMLPLIVAGAILAVASLGPYFTKWERWPTAEAYRSLATELESGQSLVVATEAQGWVAFFYAPALERVWVTEAGIEWLARGDALTAHTHMSSCDELRTASPAGLRIIDSAKPDRPDAQALAEGLVLCAGSLPIWTWEGSWRRHSSATSLTN